MDVEYEGSIFRVLFFKKHDIHGKGKHEVDLIETGCKIIQLRQGDTPTIISQESVKQYFKDKYDKIVGKKLALLKTMCFRGKSDKELRTLIWKKFEETFGAWSQEKKNARKVS